MIFLPFNNRYARLGKKFHAVAQPTSVPHPECFALNTELITQLGLCDAGLNTAEGTAVFAGNLVPAGADPLAMAYAGHQFGHYNPQLGDGRAILLGEIENPQGKSFGIQLKGSGRTFYSRDGDGRSALGPVLREYLLSEAMAKLAVPTTRALAAVSTGELVTRQTHLPGGILVRVAESFVRTGTFQYFAARGDNEAVRKLTDYVIESSFPHLREVSNPCLALLKDVTDRQAALMAKWMLLGFVHGVMNTDNMAVNGDTIDYGPCAFMDTYAHDRVFSSIDRGARYAYGNQPSIGLWNLTRLAETMLPLLAKNTEASVEMAEDILNAYPALYQQYWLSGMRDKLGLLSERHDDKELFEDLLDLMARQEADFTLTFSCLSQLGAEPSVQDEQIRGLCADPACCDAWLAKWRARLDDPSCDDAQRQARMRAVNPVYIPRNHQVEAAIRAAEDRHDFSAFHALFDVLQHPFERQEDQEMYELAPTPEQVITQTFCGT